MISLYIFVIVQVIFCSASLLNGQTVTCSAFGIEKKINGIQGYTMFKKHENQCGDMSTIVLRYTDCHVESIELNITKIKAIFPNLKTLYWFCKGYCRIGEMNIHVDVIGCAKGEYIYIYFILSSGSSFSDDHIYEDFQLNQKRSDQLAFKKIILWVYIYIKYMHVIILYDVYLEI